MATIFTYTLNRADIISSLHIHSLGFWSSFYKSIQLFHTFIFLLYNIYIKITWSTYNLFHEWCTSVWCFAFRFMVILFCYILGMFHYQLWGGWTEKYFYLNLSIILIMNPLHKPFYCTPPNHFSKSIPFSKLSKHPPIIKILGLFFACQYYSKFLCYPLSI